MRANFGCIFLLIAMTYLSCEEQDKKWKIPIGYQDYQIALGDDFNDVEGKIGKLKMDINSGIGNELRDYLKLSKQIEIDNLSLAPAIFLRFNRNKISQI